MPFRRARDPLFIGFYDLKGKKIGNREKVPQKLDYSSNLAQALRPLTWCPALMQCTSKAMHLLSTNNF